MKKALILKSIYITLLTVFISLAILVFILPYPDSWTKMSTVQSLNIKDRNNQILRELLSEQEGRAKWLELKEISPYIINSTIISEDKRFYSHFGVDILAIFRAMYQNISSLDIISGGSTISQQLVRNLHNNNEKRSLLSKITEAIEALWIEQNLDKDTILTQYLNRISYGNQIFGISRAANIYFEKSAKDLTLAESCFLVVIPRSPSRFNPYHNFKAVKKRQELLLKSIYDKGLITRKAYNYAINEEITLTPYDTAFKAPHFVNFVIQSLNDEYKSNVAYLKTTLDLTLQREVQLIVDDFVDKLNKKGITNASCIILDVKTGDILTMVGSRDFFNDEISGEVNGALARRQPGSTLKPFTYATALEHDYTAASILADTQSHFATKDGDYSPNNYDYKFHGPVRIRTALANSLNIPAVKITEKLGIGLVFKTLLDLGFRTFDKDSTYYGLGITLGNGEVSLIDLVNAYACLARKGVWKDFNFIMNAYDEKKNKISLPEKRKDKKVFSKETAFIISDILSDDEARIPSFGYYSPLNLDFKVAAKTGTSKNYRDNWTCGYTPDYVVGVWAGDFSGKEMKKVSGVSGAGPIFNSVMTHLYKDKKTNWYKKPANVIKTSICPLSGEIPTENCPGSVEEYFIKSQLSSKKCSYHKKVFIDKRNNLLAASTCPLDYVFTKFYIEYPPEYSSWAYKTGNLYSPPVDYSDLCKEEIINHSIFNEKQHIKITFPDNGDVFKMQDNLPDKYEKIRMTAKVTGNVKSIIWFVDNEEIAISDSPYTLFWQLERGKHIIQAKSKDGLKSNKVEIFVR